MNDAAKQLVDELLGDLDDRSGFDTGLVDPRAMDEWRGRWEVMVSRALEAARAEGYAQAREGAATRVENERFKRLASDAAGLWGVLKSLADDIRAMQDGAGDCPSCEHESHGGMVCGDGLACLCVRSS